MGETFYTILGVEQDADSGAIRQAYRSQVKECHPDVTDDPDASERFKRLTTARDALLDTDERSAYDRLGHDAYIRQYVDSSVWTPAADGDTTTTGNDSHTGETWGASRSDSAARGWNSTGESTTWNRSSGSRSRGTAGGDTAAGTDRRRRDRRRTQRPRWSRGHRTERTGRRRPYAGADASTGGSSPLKTAFGILRRLGSWLVIYLTLVVSALATTWFMLNRPGTDPTLAAATGVFSLLLVGVVLLLSLVHLLTELS